MLDSWPINTLGNSIPFFFFLVHHYRGYSIWESVMSWVNRICMHTIQSLASSFSRKYHWMRSDVGIQQHHSPTPLSTSWNRIMRLWFIHRMLLWVDLHWFSWLCINHIFNTSVKCVSGWRWIRMGGNKSIANILICNTWSKCVQFPHFKGTHTTHSTRHTMRILPATWFTGARVTDATLLWITIVVCDWCCLRCYCIHIHNCWSIKNSIINNKTINANDRNQTTSVCIHFRIYNLGVAGQYSMGMLAIHYQYRRSINAILCTLKISYNRWERIQKTANTKA